MAAPSAPARRPACPATMDFATQSNPEHVALIMDGNRRWARMRGLPATAGHRKGAETVESLLKAVSLTSIQTLTLFAFAAANWQRPRAEVRQLMRLARTTLSRCARRCVTEGIAIEVIGRRDRLPDELLKTIVRVEGDTAGGRRRLRVAFDYSSREAILAAALAIGADADPVRVAAELGGSDVDLLIRTGREQRLSDFLLWECAFAELYFPDVFWPDFDAKAFDAALEEYATRVRRFGGVAARSSA